MRTLRFLPTRISLFVCVLMFLLVYLNVEGPSYFRAWSEKWPLWSHTGRETKRDVATSRPLDVPTQMIAALTSTYSSASLDNKFKPEWWKNQTAMTCRALGMSTNVSLVPAYAFEKILVDNRNKLMFCHMAKVASTNLGRIFAILAGLFNGTNPNLIRSHEVHMKYNSLHVHLNAVPIAEIPHKLQSYYKFTFVRDPLERLLSAYINKFTKPPSNFFSNLSKKVATVYRTNSTLRGGATFEEFIRYVADPQRKVPTNSHWEPFYDLCRPCEVMYDFVGKLPTFNEDTRHILEVNNLTNIIEFPKMPDTLHSLHKTDLLMEKYYSTIPRELLIQVFKTYFPDYAIFDLPVPSAIKQLMA